MIQLGTFLGYYLQNLRKSSTEPYPHSGAKHRDGTTTVDVANGLTQLLAVVLTRLLGTKEGAKVRETTRRGRAGNDEGLAKNDIIF